MPPMFVHILVEIWVYQNTNVDKILNVDSIQNEDKISNIEKYQLYHLKYDM